MLHIGQKKYSLQFLIIFLIYLMNKILVHKNLLCYKMFHTKTKKFQNNFISYARI